MIGTEGKPVPVTEWTLRYEGYAPREEGLREALCTTGNGYFATRGAAPESSADGAHYPGTYIAGCYNALRTEIAGRSVDSESLVNAPNWLPLTFAAEDGPWLDLDHVDVLERRQELDLRRGVLTRRVRIRDGQAASYGQPAAGSCTWGPRTWPRWRRPSCRGTGQGSSASGQNWTARCRTRVVSASEKFLFNPSLIWLPFGKRSPADITFPLAPTFESHGVDFVHAEATTLDLDGHKVTTTGGVYDYDYLIIATGYRNNFEVVPGLGPGGNAHTITTLDDAIKAGEGWRRFLKDPGDIVVGATQGAGCFGAAYEYLFNLSHQLRKAGLKRQVKLTWVSAEPFLGHFGIGGLPHGEALLSMFLKKEHITPVMSTAMDHVDEGRLVLADGKTIDFRYAVIVPPFVGQDVIKSAGEIADAKGCVQVRDTYQTISRDEIYAVGIAVAVDVPWQTPTSVGVPKTGFPAERMAHVAARNIAAQIKGEQPASRQAFGDIPAVCVMDAGNNGVIILADKMLPPRKHGVLIPGPQAHAMKLAFEKYFLWKARHGYVGLP